MTHEQNINDQDWRREWRRMWHDCYHVPKNDVIARLCRSVGKDMKSPYVQTRIEVIGGQKYKRVWCDELAKNSEGKPLKFSTLIPLIDGKSPRPGPKDFFDAWDPIMRGRVQGAIKSLPSHLIKLGMYLYGPLSCPPEHVELLQERIKTDLMNNLKPEQVLKWRAVRYVRTNYLIFAALYFYRRFVFLDKKPGPVEIGDYLYQEFGERIPHIAQVWERDWKDIWKKTWRVIDRWEREALVGMGAKLAEEPGDVSVPQEEEPFEINKPSSIRVVKDHPKRKSFPKLKGLKK